MSYAWELRCKSSRTRDMPPARRYAPRCPPNSTSFVGGRPRDDFDAVVRFCVPSCNSLLISERHDAKRQRGVEARGKPPNLGVAMNAVKSGGHVMPSARPETKLLSANHRPRNGARVSPLFQAQHSHSPGLPGEWLSKQDGGRKRAVTPSPRPQVT